MCDETTLPPSLRRRKACKDSCTNCSFFVDCPTFAQPTVRPICSAERWTIGTLRFVQDMCLCEIVCLKQLASMFDFLSLHGPVQTCCKRVFILITLPNKCVLSVRILFFHSAKPATTKSYQLVLCSCSLKFTHFKKEVHHLLVLVLQAF